MKRTALVLLLFATLLLSVLLFSSCGKTEGQATANAPAGDGTQTMRAATDPAGAVTSATEKDGTIPTDAATVPVTEPATVPVTEPVTESEPEKLSTLFHEGLLAVERNKKWGFIDQTGREVIPCKYAFVTPFLNGAAIVYDSDDAPRYYIKPDGTHLLETPYYRATLFDSYGRAVVWKSETAKAQLIDQTGKSYFTAKDIVWYDTGVYLFEDDNELWGVVDRDGTVLMPARYDALDFARSASSIWDFYEDQATPLPDRLIARRKGSSGETQYLIDLEGNELYRAKKGYTIMKGSVNGRFIVSSSAGGRYSPFILIDSTGKEIATIEENMQLIGISAAGILVEVFEATGNASFTTAGPYYTGYGAEYDTYYRVIDWSGNVLHDFKDSAYDADDDTFWWNEMMIETRGASGWLYGVMETKTGKILIPMEYEDLSFDGFDSNGYIIGQKEEDGDFVVLDRTGRTVFTVSCDELSPFGTATETPYYVAKYQLGKNSSYELLDKEGNVAHSFGIAMRPYAYYDDGYIVAVEYEDGDFAGCTVLNGAFEEICPAIYDNYWGG